MIRNYLKMAWRSLMKHRFYTVLNVAGLSLGLSCFILILLYLRYEWGYDRYHHHADTIYRVAQTITTGDGSTQQVAATPNPLGPALAADYPDLVKSTTRFWHYWGLGFTVQYRENLFKEVNFAFSDAAVVDIFDFEFVRGNPARVLSEPFSVVISESMVQKYFGEADPLGKFLRVNEGYDLRVTGVIRDMPAQSHFHFDFLASYATLSQLPWRRYLNDWRDNFCYTYLRLAGGVSPRQLVSRLPALAGKYLPPEIAQRHRYFLQPLVDIHLRSHLEDELSANSSVFHHLILASIALFILGISMINYVNLTTAYYTARLREIGVRKVLGARRGQLVGQFIGEAVLLALLALLVTLALLELVLPVFNQMIGKDLTLSPLSSPQLFGLLIFLTLIIALLSGIYPAAYLASFQPVQVLGGLPRIDFKKGRGRRILVGVQLTLAAFLIMGALTIHRQVTFIDNYNLAFDNENILILPVNQTPISGEHYEAFTAEIRGHPAIVSATGLRTIAGFEHIKEEFAFKGTPLGEGRQLPFLLVRPRFLETFGIDLLAGRDFSEDFPGDQSGAVLVNATLAKLLGDTPEEAIGQHLRHPGWGDLQVIGVIGDFHFESLHSAIKPLVVKLIWSRRATSLTDYLAVRLRPGDPAGTLQYLQQQWKRFAPHSAFDFFFLDQQIRQSYRTENTLRQLSGVFTVIAIVVACLGLLGLVSYMVERRTKEIALRKVFGASVPGIVGLISREFVGLILLANLLAAPLAYLAANTWLQQFAFRRPPTPGVFLLAVALTALTTFLAIFFHILRAAWRPPVGYLRYE